MAGRTWLLKEPGIGEAGQLHRDRQYHECGYGCFAVSLDVPPLWYLVPGRRSGIFKADGSRTISGISVKAPHR